MVLAIDKNDSIEDPEDARKILVFALTIVWITLAAYVIWASIPLLNTVYLGAQLYNIGWWILLFVSLNIAMPFSLLNTLINPQSVARADVNFVISWTIFFFDLFALIALVVFLLFILNTVFSGFLPFNGYLWCCVYTSSSYCTTTPPLGPCVPAVSYLDVTPNSEFYWHLGFTIFFFIMSIFFIGINKILRTSGIVAVTPSSIKNALNEGRLLGLFYLLIYAVVYIVWAGIPLLNTINTSQNFYYWLQFVLAINLLPLYAMFLALVNRKGSTLWSYLYLVITVIMAILSGIVFFIMIAYVVLDIQNSTLVQSMVFALFFTLLNSFGIWIYFRMRVYGAIQ